MKDDVGKLILRLTLGILILFHGVSKLKTGAALIFINMIFAFVLVHRPDLFTIGKQGGWALELQGMYLFTALALVFLGPGRYSVSRRF